MRKFVSIFILCILFSIGVRPGFGAVAVVAQAETPPVVVEQPVGGAPLPLVDIDATGETLVGVVNGIVNGGVNAAWFAPIVALLVGLLKQVPALYKESPEDKTGVSAPALSFAVSSVIWIASAVVTRVGVDAQFSSFMDLVVQTSPYLFGFLATLGIAPAVHEYAAKLGTPVLGTKRSPQGAVAALGQAVVEVDEDDDEFEDWLQEVVDKRLEQYFERARVVAGEVGG